MSKTFHCTVVTPSQAAFDEAVQYADLPAFDGHMGVMAGASPFLAKLGYGPLRVDLPGGGSKSWLLEGGFAQMQGEKLTILTERAIPTESLNVAEAQRELIEANAAVVRGGDRDRLERAQQLAYAKLAAARR